jgi:O-antigen/teichoic acid export membrane protein
MSIGVGIFLLALGAILAFGVRDSLDAIDLTVIGFVIMAAGALGIALSFYITNRRRRVPTDALDPAVEEEYRVVEERRDVIE